MCGRTNSAQHLKLVRHWRAIEKFRLPYSEGKDVFHVGVRICRVELGQSIINSQLVTNQRSSIYEQ